jgi:hypothetical protein
MKHIVPEVPLYVSNENWRGRNMRLNLASDYLCESISNNFACIGGMMARCQILRESY